MGNLGDKPLSPDAVRGLFRLAREALAGALRDCAAGRTLATEEPAGPYYTVNVTVYQDRRLCASTSGRGGSLAAATGTAARRAAADRRFGHAIAPESVPELRLDLWVLTGMALFTSAADMLATLDLGLDGVELRLGSRTAYYKPSVALTSGVTDPARLMLKLARKAGLGPGAWRNPRARIWRTSWEHFVDAPPQTGRPMRLRRLRPVREVPLEAAVVAGAARAAQERLLTVQADDGSYLYRYHPLKDQIPGRSANIVRLAGTTYAMARSAAGEADPARAEMLRRSAQNALDFLLRRQVRTTGRGCFIRDLGEGPPRGQLGTAALALLALQYIPCAELDEAHARAKTGLRTWVLNQQNPDGCFRCFSDTISAAANGVKQDYFPGEAMLALAHEATRGNTLCAEALDRGFPWYRAHFRRFPATAFVPWHVDTWRLFAELPGGSGSRTGQGPLTAFVFELADWVLQRQFVAADVPPDFFGGFAAAGRRPGASTATYTEAVIRAFGLALRAGDQERARRYQVAAHRGLRFALRLQISPETAALFPVPSRAVGGTTTALDNFAIRCDNDQHLITACITALETPRLLELRNHPGSGTRRRPGTLRRP